MVERVSLYRAPTTVADASAVAEWLDPRIEGDVEVREPALQRYRDGDLPSDLADARVLSPYDRETGTSMTGAVRYEERALDDPERAGGVLYDGHRVQRALEGRVPTDEYGLDEVHVAILDRHVGTWGDDGRWHKRVNVLGPVSIVSVPGLYEAPAKPEAYYREKQRHALLSGDAPPREVLENEVEGEFLVPGDPRTTDALKGYVLQAVHYLETGEAFCEDADCRLYNAHHQSELVEAQLRDPEFCPRHAERYGHVESTT